MKKLFVLSLVIFVSTTSVVSQDAIGKEFTDLFHNNIMDGEITSYNNVKIQDTVFYSIVYASKEKRPVEIYSFVKGICVEHTLIYGTEDRPKIDLSKYKSVKMQEYMSATLMFRVFRQKNKISTSKI